MCLYCLNPKKFSALSYDLCHNNPMFKKFLQISFYIYAFFFLWIGFIRLGALFSLDAPQGLYFHILCAFDNSYCFTYTLALLQVSLAIIHFIPLILFLSKTYLLPTRFWQYLFLLRIIFDIAGHPWEINYLSSFWDSRPGLVIITICLYVSLSIPSYVGCYYYAFKKHSTPLELFKK